MGRLDEGRSRNTWDELPFAEASLRAFRMLNTQTSTGSHSFLIPIIVKSYTFRLQKKKKKMIT